MEDRGGCMENHVLCPPNVLSTQDVYHIGVLDRGLYHVMCHGVYSKSGNSDDGFISEDALGWGFVGS